MHMINFNKSDADRGKCTNIKLMHMINFNKSDADGGKCTITSETISLEPSRPIMALENNPDFQTMGTMCQVRNIK